MSPSSIACVTVSFPRANLMGSFVNSSRSSNSQTKTTLSETSYARNARAADTSSYPSAACIAGIKW